jgi:hypothetical protein
LPDQATRSNIGTSAAFELTIPPSRSEAPHDDASVAHDLGRRRQVGQPRVDAGGGSTAQASVASTAGANRSAAGGGSDATDEELVTLQRDTFGYFAALANPANGLVPDNTRQSPRAPCSITAVGLALATYPVGVERGFMTRATAIARTLATLRFFSDAPHGPDPDATGHHGFYYHFLDMESGRRVWQCELSTVDSAFLLAGALTAATYFTGEGPDEVEIRRLGTALYERADWQWALDGGPTVSHGWRPEAGFIPHRWEGYSEAILLYALGLGSPTSPLPAESYEAFTATYEWRRLFGVDVLHAGPLFIHQLSHCWIDFRAIKDRAMRERTDGSDYFENSRRATAVQRAYAIENPRGFAGYGEHCWGVTASDGPGPLTVRIGGRKREFYDYLARGVPDGPDDGTIAPWGAVASLPFAPELVLPLIEYVDRCYPEMRSKFGFKCSFNPTYRPPRYTRASPTGDKGWISQGYFGLDQGPIVLMIDNYRTGFVWDLMRRCPPLVRGLRRAGFRGGWLDHAPETPP